MNFSVSLDRYLTTPFDDGFDNYFEAVTEKLSSEFFDDNEEWVLEDRGQYNTWLNRCYYQKQSGKNIKETAQVIERAHRIYKLKTPNN
jgi:hypothetical protein